MFLQVKHGYPLLQITNPRFHDTSCIGHPLSPDRINFNSISFARTTDRRSRRVTWVGGNQPAVRILGIPEKFPPLTARTVGNNSPVANVPSEVRLNYSEAITEPRLSAHPFIDPRNSLRVLPLPVLFRRSLKYPAGIVAAEK